MIFFTSDSHFGHFNIIEYCNRPFKSVMDMDEELIFRWNSVVQSGDDVYHLGDFCMGRKSVPNMWLPRLNGNVHLIRGNHDYKVEGQGFASVQDYKELKIKKKKLKFVLFHYPVNSWNGCFVDRCKKRMPSWHLFGHVHGRLTSEVGSKTWGDRLAMDVGVDSNDYYPVSLLKVQRIMGEKALELGFV